jgi:hypothetical protein
MLVTTNVTLPGNWIPAIPAGMTGEQLQKYYRSRTKNYKKA